VTDDNHILYLPLYDGACKAVLQAVAEHFEWFTSHPGTSKEALSELLQMEHNTLPKGNLLPATYYSAYKLIEPFLLKPKVYHACPNDCIIFHKEYTNAITCPKCASARYIHKNIPAKKFVYLPLRPQIVRIFNYKTMAKLVQAHPGALESSSSLMYDIHDSRVWKEAYSKTGIFREDHRGMSFALCTDGVNPFFHNHIAYSMWPIMLTLLNFQRYICNSYNSIFVAGMIPGNGTHEPKNLDPYMEILVNEILELTDIQMYDAHQGSTFNFRAEILSYVLDYPGVGKLFKVCGSGAYKGCAWCDIKGIQ